MSPQKSLFHITHPRYLQHETGGDKHPEIPGRLKEIASQLHSMAKTHQIIGLEPCEAERRRILAIHSNDYLLHFEETALTGLSYLGHPDNSLGYYTYEIALLAAGAGLAGVDLAEKCTNERSGLSQTELEMNTVLLVQSLISGIMMGAAYTLLGVGFSLTWGVMKVIHISHAAFGLIGAFLAYTLLEAWGLDPIFSLALSVPLLFLVACVIYRFLIAPITKAKEVIVSSMILTFGIAIILEICSRC